MKPRGILETALYVNNLEIAKKFYIEVIGLKLHAEEAGRHVFLECGPGMMLLFNAQATKTGDIPHGASGAGHVAFKVGETELDGWRAHLTKYDVPIEKEMDWPEGTKSFYFRDPAGNSLEIATAKLWGLES